MTCQSLIGWSLGAGGDEVDGAVGDRFVAEFDYEDDFEDYVESEPEDEYDSEVRRFFSKFIS